jgi:hypothetical protein
MTAVTVAPHLLVAFRPKLTLALSVGDPGELFVLENLVDRALGQPPRDDHAILLHR